MLKSVVILGLLGLAVNQVCSSANSRATSAKESDYFQLDVYDYSRSITEPKNIVIATSFGGSSHTKWVLEVGQLLVNRGHNVTYITRSDQVHLVNAFPKIPAISVGEPVYKHVDVGVIGRQWSFYKIVQFVRQSLNDAYADEMRYYQQSMESKPDFFICDAFDDPCIDIAVEWKVPFAITCTGILHQDMSVPYMNSLGTTHHATSEHMTLWERFHHKYIDAIKVMYHLYPEMKRLDKIRQEHGLKPLGLNRFKQWDNAIKLINTYHGFMPPQVVSPLTYIVGPILSTKQRLLSPGERNYLDTHRRVVYAAFGSIVLLDKEAVEAILGALLDQIELGQIDGIIWAGLEKQIALYENKTDDVKWTIRTTKHVYNLGAPLLKHDMLSDVYTPEWASQFSILAHPSTVLFVSHGGAESVNEATFNGVPLMVFPYYGDGRLVARRMELAGVARVHERSEISVDVVREHLNELLLDVNGTIAENVMRMKTLAQLGSRRKSRAADLVEEHMYTSVDGISEHRYEPSRRMSAIKAMNIDLHAAVLFFAALTGYTLYSVIRLL